MALSMLSSLALMLLLFATILHLVALTLPAWIQLGVYVPLDLNKGGGRGGGLGGERRGGGGRGGGERVGGGGDAEKRGEGPQEGEGMGKELEDIFGNVTTISTGEAGGSGGRGAEGGRGGGGATGGSEDAFSTVTEVYLNVTTGTSSTAFPENAAAAVVMEDEREKEEKEEEEKEQKEQKEEDSDYFLHYNGPRVFVSVRLSVWHWCQQFRHVTPSCEEPGFVGGVGVMMVVVLFTLPTSFALLCYSACLQRDLQEKKRLLTRVSLYFSAFSGLILLATVAIYGVLGRREVTAMLLQIGQLEESRTFLGWAFGAEVVVCLLTCLAALFLGLHLRQTPKAYTPEFQLVV